MGASGAEVLAFSKELLINLKIISQNNNNKSFFVMKRNLL